MRSKRPALRKLDFLGRLFISLALLERVVNEPIGKKYKPKTHGVMTLLVRCYELGTTVRLTVLMGYPDEPMVRVLMRHAFLMLT